MIKTKHKQQNCGYCGVTVICWKCGMNVCGGMTGEINGIECDQCADARKAQRIYDEDYKSIIFSNTHEFIESLHPLDLKYKNKKDTSDDLMSMIAQEEQELAERNKWRRSVRICQQPERRHMNRSSSG